MVFLPPRLERYLSTELHSLMLNVVSKYLAASLNANPVMIVASDSGYRIDYNMDYLSYQLLTCSDISCVKILVTPQFLYVGQASNPPDHKEIKQSIINPTVTCKLLRIPRPATIHHDCDGQVSTSFPLLLPVVELLDHAVIFQ